MITWGGEAAAYVVNEARDALEDSRSCFDIPFLVGGDSKANESLLGDGPCRSSTEVSEIHQRQLSTKAYLST
jgi:hypothetical protein